MKKLLLSLALGVSTIMMANAGSLTVYKNGSIQLTNDLDGEGGNPDALFTYYSWWNADVDFVTSRLEETNAPSDGQVMKFWANGAAGYTDASFGIYLANPGKTLFGYPLSTGMLHDATLTFDYYMVGSGTYTLRLTAGEGEAYEEDYNLNTENFNGNWTSVSIKIADAFPKISKFWNEGVNDQKGYVFAVILTNGKEGDAIYFNNIEYKDTDETWEPADNTDAEPADVPTPTLASSDVLSIFSSAYAPATTFNIGYWGQTTGSELIEIDGKKVYKLRAFNYLGWELNPHINISDYEYMHVDFWTAVETPFGFTPISPSYEEGVPNLEKGYVVPNVVLIEWNSYDVPLSYWAEDVDLSDIFQIKFDQGAGPEVIAYLTNVYFWKGEGPDGPGTDEPGTGGEGNGATYRGKVDGTYTQTMSADDVKEYDYILNYQITYNEDKTLSMTGNFDWADNTPVGYTGGLICTIPGVWTNNAQEQGAMLTTDVTFEKDEEVEITFATAVAMGNVEVKVPYVVGSINQGSSSSVSAVEVSELVDIYTITGIRVARNVNFKDIRSSLAPGIYIVGGKKVVVK